MGFLLPTPPPPWADSYRHARLEQRSRNGTDPTVVGVERHAEDVARLPVEVGDAGLGRLKMPTLTSRCAERCSARMRKVTDLPVPGAPWS
jgi:hypothetical protein